MTGNIKGSEIEYAGRKYDSQVYIELIKLIAYQSYLIIIKEKTSLQSQGMPPNCTGNGWKMPAHVNLEFIVAAAYRPIAAFLEIDERLINNLFDGDGVLEHSLRHIGIFDGFRYEGCAYPSGRHLQNTDAHSIQFMPQSIAIRLDERFGGSIYIQIGKRKICRCGTHLDHS